MGRTELGAAPPGKYPEPDLGEMLLGLPLISSIARPRQVRKLPRCESGGGRVLCPYYSCRFRRATTAMPEISEFRFAPDSPVEGDGFEPSVPLQVRSRFRDLSPVPLLTGSRPGTGSSNPSPSSGESSKLASTSLC